MRLLFAFLMLFALALAYGSEPNATPAHLPEGEDSSLTFLLTFDKKSVVADFARGNPNSTTFEGNLEFRLIPGFNDENAFNLRDDEQLKYEVAGNVSPAEGTLILWVMAKNYDPGLVGSGTPDPSHKSYAYIRFANGSGWLDLYLYQYYQSPDVYFYWNSSFSPNEQYRLAAIPLNKIRRNQWFQVAVTWTDKVIRTYMNGEFMSETVLPPEAGLAAKIDPLPRRSFLEIRGHLWRGPEGMAKGKETVVDDIRVYSRALNAIEIRKQFARVAPATLGERPQNLGSVDIQLTGVDDRQGPLDRLRVSLDYLALPPDWKEAIAEGGLSARMTLLRPDGKKIEEEWTPASIQESRILTGADLPGRYTVDVEVRGSQGAVEKGHAEIVRPDTSWYGNQLGLDFKEPPKPWTPLKVSADQTVSIWNRTYKFNGTPFPQSILNGGDEMLAEPVELIIEQNGKKTPIQYSLSKEESDANSAVFSGTGKGPDFTLDWVTRVDFDGLIRTDFTVHGKPAIEKMRLQWTVRRPFADFILDPLLAQTGNGLYQAAFPHTEGKGSILWLTSEKKGFCWMPEHDANWVYDPATDTPIQANIDDAGGHCSVTMVEHSTKIPQGASYHSMWIATPSRPLPKIFRTYRFGGYNRFSHCDVALVQHAGEGTDGVFSLKPGPNFAREMEHLRQEGMTRLAIYGGATGLNDYCAEGKYFQEYWEIPGLSTMVFENTFDNITCRQTNPDPCTGYSDYILNNIKLLLDNPAQQYAAIYYDLAGNALCSNLLHGHQFEDAFGRKISPFIIMGLRKHLMRTMAYAHSRGLDTIYHAHSYYNPAVHAFGDYWFPGEQYSSEIQRAGTPYFYSDLIPDDVFRSELNMFLKGSGLLFLGNLGRANTKYGSEEQTRAMCTKLLLNDIPISIAFEDGKVINQIWGAALKYDLDNATVTKYYEPHHELDSSNPNVKITYYQTPDDRYLIIAGNVSTEDQSAEIDLSRLPLQGKFVTDEYYNVEVPVSQDKVKVDIKAREFALLGLNSKQPTDKKP